MYNVTSSHNQLKHWLEIENHLGLTVWYWKPTILNIKKPNISLHKILGLVLIVVLVGTWDDVYITVHAGGGGGGVHVVCPVCLP